MVIPYPPRAHGMGRQWDAVYSALSVVLVGSAPQQLCGLRNLGNGSE